MKKLFKLFLILVILFGLGLGAYIVYLKYFASAGNVNAFNTVPSETLFIVETDNLTEAWNEIKTSDLWKYLQTTDYFSDLNEDIEDIDMFLDSNQLASNLLKNRELIMSAVLTKNDWDFLFSVDLQKGSGTIKSLKGLVDFIDGYNVWKIPAKINGKDYEIIKMQDQEYPEDFYYITFADNILLFSFKEEILEKALNEMDDNHWQTDNKFVEISKKIPGKKLFKIYMKYSELDDYMRTMVTTEDETVNMLSNSLAYSVLNFDLDDNTIILDGYTNIDSSGTYINALATVDPAKMQAYKIMTNQTAAYVSICFDDYMTFYNNLMEVYRKDSPEDAEDIDKYLDLLKRVIKIDIQNDFFNWIGNEIALFKIRPLSNVSKEEDIALVIDANDIEAAKQGMTHITEQIRKWSPFKFKSYDYKNFQINYLKQKGFFKPFFGKLFEDIENPYYTFIGHYVVFTNSEEVLKQIIDDFVSGNTLANDEKFNDFVDEFSSRSTIGIFINMPKMYPTLYYFTPAKDRKDLKENEDLIKSFARIGFQLVNIDGTFMRTTLRAEYDSTATYEDYVQVIEQQTQIESFQDYVDTLGFAFELPDTAEDGRFVDYYDNGQIKIECDVADGKITGTCRSYYQDGNIAYSLNYVEGLPDGVGFFYYDSKANTLRAEVNFEDGKLNGVYKEYYDNGAQKSKIIYEDGEENGEAEYYYTTGALKMKGKFKDGKKHGKWIYYDEDGNKIAVEKWKNGERKR